MPGARCTRGLVCKLVRKKRTRAYRFSGNTPAFPAQWFYGLCRALPGDEFVLPPSPTDQRSFRDPVGLEKTSAGLTPATGARTTRFCRTPQRRRQRAGDRSRKSRPAIPFHALTLPRPSHPQPTSVTIAIRPSSRAGMGRASTGDLPDGGSEIFLHTGLDSFLLICPSGSIEQSQDG